MCRGGSDLTFFADETRGAEMTAERVQIRILVTGVCGFLGFRCRGAA